MTPSLIRWVSCGHWCEYVKCSHAQGTLPPRVAYTCVAIWACVGWLAPGATYNCETPWRPGWECSRRVNAHRPLAVAPTHHRSSTTRSMLPCATPTPRPKWVYDLVVASQRTALRSPIPCIGGIANYARVLPAQCHEDPPDTSG